jgi:phosphoserine phosphatase
VVSASISDWVKPFFDKDELMVIGTEVEYDANECLTGHFLTPNCYGEEKVKRLLAMEPDRDSYFLISYGDSEGDKEIIQFADRSYYQAFK